MTLNRPTRALRRQAAIADLRRRERIAAALTFRANQRTIARELLRFQIEDRVRRAAGPDWTVAHVHPDFLAPTPESDPR